MAFNYKSGQIMGRKPKSQIQSVAPRNPGNALVNKIRKGK